jgi:hypothetical protein
MAFYFRKDKGDYFKLGIFDIISIIPNVYPSNGISKLGVSNLVDFTVAYL